MSKKPTGRIELKIINGLLTLVVFTLPSSSFQHSLFQVESPYEGRELTSIFRKDQQDDATVRIETNLVTITASVMDRDGRYLTDLRQEDFQIFEDGVEQKIAFFEPVDRPFTVLLLLDISGSMSTRLQDLVRAANIFVSKLRPDDRLIAATFVDTLHVVLKATRVDQITTIKVRPHRGERSTMIYDAVDDALNIMKKIHGRKAIVLFSDGIGTGVFATAKGTLQRAEEQEAIIYTVQFNTASREAPPYISRKAYLKELEEANTYMKELASRTGGRSFQIENISDLGQTFGQVADELRRQYSLGYYPQSKNGSSQRRSIKVKVLRPGAIVRARDSYVPRT